MDVLKISHYLVIAIEDVHDLTNLENPKIYDFLKKRLSKKIF